MLMCARAPECQSLDLDLEDHECSESLAPLLAQWDQVDQGQGQELESDVVDPELEQELEFAHSGLECSARLLALAPSHEPLDQGWGQELELSLAL
jgi:hypothetical protein